MNDQLNVIEPIDEEISKLIDHIYSITPSKMKMPDGSVQEVNPDGNLGLLACGYTGIVAWRKKREEFYGEKIYSPLIDYIKKAIDKRKQEDDATEKV